MKIFRKTNEQSLNGHTDTQMYGHTDDQGRLLRNPSGEPRGLKWRLKKEAKTFFTCKASEKKSIEQNTIEFISIDSRDFYLQSNVNIHMNKILLLT